MKTLQIIVIGCNPLTRVGIEVVRGLSCCRLAGIILLSPEAAAGKSNYDPMPSIVKEHADIILYTDDINSSAVEQWILEKEPDILLQLGWSQIFKKRLLLLPQMFCMGIHPAPLPVGRGAAVINWKIIEGGGEWGNTLFVMKSTTDTGDILDFEPFAIEPRDDVYTAFCKVDKSAAKMMRRVLPRIADGTYTLKKQDKTKATRYYKRTPEDGKVEPGWDASRAQRYVRALTHPYPGAFFHTAKGKLMVWEVETGEKTNLTVEPGAIVEIIPGQGVLVKAGKNDTLLLKRVTPPGDLECWADEWALESGFKKGEVILLKI